MPAGFDPVSFTAISADSYWLLGTAPCHKPVCTSIVRTTDDGRHFVGIPAPPVPLTSGDNSSASIDTLRFANPVDGYAFNAQSFPRTDGSSDPIWETHDGGAHWRTTQLRHTLAFTTSGGYVFFVTGSCNDGTCSRLELRRTPIGKDSWTSQPLPIGRVDPLVAATAHGASLWLSLSPTANGQHPSQVLLASNDSGLSFRSETSPCFTGLGGTLAASSASVIWAICPTGMLAGAYRSADAGASWSPLHAGHGLANSAQIAPASDTTATVAPGDQTQLFRTTDAGATFTAIVYPIKSGFWSFLGFTDAQTGSGLLVTTHGGKSRHELVRSSDGGARWSASIPVGN